MTDASQKILAEAIGATPECDALSARIYNDSCAAAADLPGYVGHEWTPEEAYSAALDLAKKLEIERTELVAALDEINTLACYVTEEDVSARYEGLIRIGEIARAAIAKANA